MATTQKKLINKTIDSLCRLSINAVAVLIAASFLAACVPSDIGNVFSKYDVLWPSEDERVVDDELAQNQTQVVVTFPDSTQHPIYFNGQQHDDCFTYSNNRATASLSCLAPFARQGENVIAINPSSLFASFTRFFVIDSTGPKLSVSNVCYESASACELNDNGDVTFDVAYIDPSELASVSVEVAGVTYAPAQLTDKLAQYTVPVSNRYVFNSVDANGYSSQHVYQKDGDSLDQLFNVRIDENMLGQLLPLINKGITGMESGNPDGSEILLENVEVQALGLVNMLADVNYIKINNFAMTNLSINDDNADLETNLHMTPLGEQGSDWSNGDGSVDTENVGIEVKMAMQDVLWCYDPLGWIPACQPCEHSAFEMCQPGLIKMNMHMFIEKMDVNARVNNDMVTEGDFHIKLEKQSSGGDVLVMHDTFPVMNGSGSVSGE